MALEQAASGGYAWWRSLVSLALWQLWPFSPVVDEVHEVAFVDGIHFSRNVVVLIVLTPDHVLGWYAATSENSRAWGVLISRIVPQSRSLLMG